MPADAPGAPGAVHYAAARGSDRGRFRPRPSASPPRRRSVRRARDRRRSHGRRRRPRRRVTRPADRAGRAHRLRRRHVVDVVEDDPRRDPLPAAVRDPARVPVAAGAPTAVAERAASRAGPALRDGDLQQGRHDPPLLRLDPLAGALVLRRHRRGKDRSSASSPHPRGDDRPHADAGPRAHPQQLPLLRRPGRRRPHDDGDRPNRRARSRRRGRQPRAGDRAAQGRRRARRRGDDRRRRPREHRRPRVGGRQRRRRVDRRNRRARRGRGIGDPPRPGRARRRAAIAPRQRCRRHHVPARRARLRVRGSLGRPHLHRHHRHRLRRRPRPSVLHGERRPVPAEQPQRVDDQRHHPG